MMQELIELAQFMLVGAGLGAVAFLVELAVRGK